MQINGPTFKVNKVNDAKAKDPAEAAFGESQQQSVEDFFENAVNDPLANKPADSSSSISNDPQAALLMGVDFSSEDVFGPASSDWLQNFPPTVNELIAEKEDAVAYLDIMQQHYQKATADLVELKQSYEATLDAGGLTAAETNVLMGRLDLLENAILKAEQQIEALLELEKTLGVAWKEELATGKDLNNDGWLGKPFSKDSLMVQVNKNGTITYIDPTSKKAVPCPIRDPNYMPELTKDGALEVIDASEAANFKEGQITEVNGKYVHEDGDMDVYLRLTEEAINKMGERDMNVACDIGIPQYVWVERNKDPDSSEAYEFQDDEDGSRMKMAAWTNGANGGVVQQVPGDMGTYMQVEVTNVEIRSIETGLTDVNSNDVQKNKTYHHVMELYNGTELIGRIRIEGYEATGNMATQTAEGKPPSYAAASSFSFGFNGDKRMSEIEFSAGGLRSTGRHLMELDEITKYVGEPPADTIGARAWHETVDAFTQQDYSTEYHDGTGWKTAGEDFSGIYSGTSYGDGYLSPDVAPGENDTVRSFNTGVFIRGLRGSIRGTAYNDVIVTPPVNEHGEYASEHMAANAEKIKFGDPFYSNCVDAGGGNSIVVAGKGDNYIMGATFVMVDADNNDATLISTPGIPSHGTGTTETKKKNPKVFIDVKGGEDTKIDIPDEFSAMAHADAEKPEDHEKISKGYVDDYINCSSESVAFSNPYYDGEYVGQAFESEISMNTAEIEKNMSEAREKFVEDLLKEPEVDEAELESSWDEVMNQKTSLDDEMNGFFDSMFGELGSLMSDMGLTDEDIGTSSL